MILPDPANEVLTPGLLRRADTAALERLARSMGCDVSDRRRYTPHAWHDVLVGRVIAARRLELRKETQAT